MRRKSRIPSCSQGNPSRLAIFSLTKIFMLQRFWSLFFRIQVKNETFKSCFVATKEPQVVFIKENWPKIQP
jgi:hypothetical protein